MASFDLVIIVTFMHDKYKYRQNNGQQDSGDNHLYLLFLQQLNDLKLPKTEINKIKFQQGLLYLLNVYRFILSKRFYSVR